MSLLDYETGGENEGVRRGGKQTGGRRNRELKERAKKRVKGEKIERERREGVKWTSSSSL